MKKSNPSFVLNAGRLNVFVYAPRAADSERSWRQVELSPASFPECQLAN